MGAYSSRAERRRRRSGRSMERVFLCRRSPKKPMRYRTDISRGLYPFSSRMTARVPTESVPSRTVTVSPERASQ